MENLFQILLSTVGLALIGSSFCLYKSQKNLKKITKKLKESEDCLEFLKRKHELNPSYDCQVAIGELLMGTALFKIERIDSENIFLRRR